MVLVHGLGVSSRYMLPTLALLAPRARVFAPDLPGFGHSTKPPHTLSLAELADSLADWMSATGLDRAVLLGNSRRAAPGHHHCWLARLDTADRTAVSPAK